MPARIEELGSGRLLVDLGFRDTDGLIASYLLPEEDGWAIVEVGPTTVRHALLEGLRQAGVEPHQVRHVLVTHIHLDHAGGLGALAEALPNATFYAHRAGVAHLVDPSRLIASARRAWGAAADPLWGAIEPVPSNRLVPLDGGESIPLKEGRLEVVATPGHARHHLSYVDTATRSVMTGDSAGVHLPGASAARPAVPPPDLDLNALFESLDRMRALEPNALWYAHFGPGPGSARPFVEYRTAVEGWRDVARAAAREKADVAYVAGALESFELGKESDPELARRTSLVSNYELAAQGLLRYLQTRGEAPTGGT